jgi:hypothetical protein
MEDKHSRVKLIYYSSNLNSINNQTNQNTEMRNYNSANSTNHFGPNNVASNNN